MNENEEMQNIPEVLEKALLFCLDTAQIKMGAGEEMAPFTAIVVKDEVFLETYPYEDTQVIYEEACKTVSGATGMAAYAFCYDGYIDTDEGEIDAIIAEGATPDMEEAIAICIPYSLEDDVYSFGEEPLFAGTCPSFVSEAEIIENQPHCEGGCCSFDCGANLESDSNQD